MCGLVGGLMAGKAVNLLQKKAAKSAYKAPQPPAKKPIATMQPLEIEPMGTTKEEPKQSMSTNTGLQIGGL